MNGEPPTSPQRAPSLAVNGGRKARPEPATGSDLPTGLAFLLVFILPAAEGSRPEEG